MSLADTASRLLATQGEAVAFIFQPATPAFDPITGAAQTPSAADTSSGYGYASAYKRNEVDGTTIKSGDIKLIVELTSPKPVVGCTATVDGRDYRVQSVQIIRKAAADVIYICQLRAS